VKVRKRWKSGPDWLRGPAGNRKGLPILLQAAKRLDTEGVKFRLTFVGDGPERDNLELLAGKLQFTNPVEFLGERQGEELAEVLRSVRRAVVMPSPWKETTGHQISVVVVPTLLSSSHAPSSWECLTTRY
jgi:glycosyltransferase involved in cell wall biosynthesis